MKLSAGFQFTLALIALVAAGAGLGALHLENNRLRRAIAVRVAHAPAAAARDENARPAAPRERGLPRDRGTEAAAELEQARREIAELENHGTTQHAQRAAQAARDSHLLALNRDPRQAPMRLEYFQDRGQATPGAAFESLVCAALRGDQPALAKYFTLPAETRRKAEALIARLPEATRGEWTPEKLATLWLTGAFVEMSAVQLTGETIVDSEQAVVMFRRPGANDSERAKLKFTPAGWKVVISSNAMDHLEKKLAAPRPAR